MQDTHLLHSITGTPNLKKQIAEARVQGVKNRCVSSGGHTDEGEKANHGDSGVPELAQGCTGKERYSEGESQQKA